MKKRILTLGIALALIATMVMPVAALATNSAGQSASTSYTTAIEIVAKTADTGVTTITFPEAAAGTAVSTPYNDVNSTDPQALSGTVSEPVVRLKNGTANDLEVWLGITAWENGVVVSEDFELVATGTNTVDVVDDVLSADGGAANINTNITIDDGTYNDLYLEVVLSSTPGLSGTSTLSVLGGAP